MEKNNNNKVLWLTGLPASGKTTLSKILFKKLSDLGMKVHHLDGDEVRDASRDKLGFSKQGRDKNIKLAIELAKKYQDQGYLVLASFITPYKAHRQWGREKIDNFIEVFVDCPVEVCQTRDPKGMYKKALTGEIENFTGISDPYELPENPDIHLETNKKTIKECAEEVINYLKNI